MNATTHLYADLNAITGIRNIAPTQENMDNGSYLANEERIQAGIRLNAEMAAWWNSEEK
jgi:hypothetical protein